MAMGWSEEIARFDRGVLREPKTLGDRQNPLRVRAESLRADRERARSAEPDPFRRRSRSSDHIADPVPLIEQAARGRTHRRDPENGIVGTWPLADNSREQRLRTIAADLQWRYHVSPKRPPPTLRGSVARGDRARSVPGAPRGSAGATGQILFVHGHGRSHQPKTKAPALPSLPAPAAVPATPKAPPAGDVTVDNVGTHRWVVYDANTPDGRTENHSDGAGAARSDRALIEEEEQMLAVAITESLRAPTENDEPAYHLAVQRSLECVPPIDARESARLSREAREMEVAMELSRVEERQALTNPPDSGNGASGSGDPMPKGTSEGRSLFDTPAPKGFILGADRHEPPRVPKGPPRPDTPPPTPHPPPHPPHSTLEAHLC
jgi:hypothetical protein